MQKNEAKLTVFFDPPFWVAVYERVTDDQLEVCKVVFGSEPKDYEVYDYFLKNWHLLRFSPPVRADATQDSRINPKRMQRAIQKQLDATGIGTKSQQALQLQHEEGKTARKKKGRLQKEEEQQRKFELRQQKRKRKHKGR